VRLCGIQLQSIASPGKMIDRDYKIMHDYSSIIIGGLVILLFTTFSVWQIKIGYVKFQQKEGFRLYNVLRVIFAIPLLVISLIGLALFLISLLP
jgi:hypothetical protein